MANVTRKGKSSVLFSIVCYSIFTLFALACVLPFYYIFINTISDNRQVSMGHVMFYPTGIHFQNYINAFKLDALPRAAMISLSRMVLGTLFTLVCASFPGYAFSRREFWHRKFFYRMMVATMYINAGVIPIFLTYKMLGLYNSYFVYVLPSVSSAFNLVLCKTYIESIPSALDESMQIDGAGYIRRYVSLILPLSLPILATVGIFSAVYHWNAYMDTVLYIVDTKLYTLQFVLYQYLNEANAIQEILRNDPSAMAGRDASILLSPITVRYTISVITALPILLVYPFAQRYFVKGIMIGAVKG